MLVDIRMGLLKASGSKQWPPCSQNPVLVLMIWLGLMAGNAVAATSLVEEPDGEAYHFVSHYRITINAPIERVWEQMLDLKSWMYEFALEPLSGAERIPGQVLGLYEGQEFKIQVLEVLPEELLVVANLPLTFRGERGTGIGVFSLHDVGGATSIELIMSRRYTWLGEGENPQRITRESDAFVSQTNAMWRDRFLERLACLSEERCADASDQEEVDD